MYSKRALKLSDSERAQTDRPGTGRGGVYAGIGEGLRARGNSGFCAGARWVSNVLHGAQCGSFRAAKVTQEENVGERLIFGVTKISGYKLGSTLAFAFKTFKVSNFLEPFAKFCGTISRGRWHDRFTVRVQTGSVSVFLSFST